MGARVVKGKRIAWIVPTVSAGSGGHRTIFQNANALISHGYSCDLYVNNSDTKKSAAEIHNEINQHYGIFNGNVFAGYYPTEDYDMIIATGWDTAEPVSQSKISKKVYFIQDFEPWFYPSGYEHILAEQSYKYGFNNITIGKWLCQKIQQNATGSTQYFDFCADIKSYKSLKNVKKELAVCCIFQPDKPRRCAMLALKSLQLLQRLRPEIKIYLYGSNNNVNIQGLDVKHLGILSVDECNKLYNKCMVGLCLSSSNPSRIPFEMMSAGLPVVELYRENNLYDLPESSCLLADPRPEAIAEAIIKILDDKKLRVNMGVSGAQYMKERTLKKGYDQFVDFIDSIFAEKKGMKEAKIKKTYTRPAIFSSSCVSKPNLPPVSIEPKTHTRNIALNQQNQQLRTELELMKKQYNQVINSKSWKITKPLRKISGH